MSAATLTMIITLLEALPGIITASEEALALIANTAANLREMQATGGDPSAAQWEAMNATINTLREKLDAPEGSTAAS